MIIILFKFHINENINRFNKTFDDIFASADLTLGQLLGECIRRTSH